jgi:hypothetical protein
MKKPKRSILIGIPAYDSKVCVNTMVSLFNNINSLQLKGYDVSFTAQIKGAYLDLNRNKIVKQFMDGDFTDLLFIDADIAFEYDAMIKIMEQPVDVIGGVYPYREIDDNGFPVDIKLDRNNYPVTDFKLKLIESEHIPTGFMRITRKALETIAEHYPHLVDDKGVYQFFATGQTAMYEDTVLRLVNELRKYRGLPNDGSVNVDVEHPFAGIDNRYFGEDVWFCKLCNACGIKVYCDPTIEFIHFGTLPKRGRFSDYLKENGTR